MDTDIQALKAAGFFMDGTKLAMPHGEGRFYLYQPIDTRSHKYELTYMVPYESETMFPPTSSVRVVLKQVRDMKAGKI